MRRTAFVHLVPLLLVPCLLAACVNKSVNDVALGDAGQAFKVKFGTVLEAHLVNIRSKPDDSVSGGALLGGGAGYALGRNEGSTVGGMLAGAVAGAMVHQMAETQNGFEYTIAFSDGTTQVIDQIQAPEDPVFAAGASVMVQFGATRNRVLSAEALPNSVAHPKEVRVAGAPKPPHSLGVKTCQKTSIGSDESRKTCTED
jgi:outer membrane lipoprotein SlyB